MPTITNFNVDSIASGVTSPFTITRVTDMGTLPTPNENHSIEFTTGYTVNGVAQKAYMSYEQLATAATRNRILNQVGGISQRAQEVKEAIAAIYAVTNALSAPHTYADYVDMIEAIREHLDVLKGYY